MPIKANRTQVYPQPSEGTVSAVAIDVVDLGIIESEFKGQKKKQHKISVIFQIDETRDDGKPFNVSKRYTLSMHEKATLRKDIESWRGKKFATQEEADDFDVEAVIGKPALLNLQRNETNGKTYTNIVTVAPLIKGATPIKADPSYVRVQNRPGYVPPVIPQQDENHEDYDQSSGVYEDEVPF